MKRFYLSLCIFLILVGICSYSLYHVYDTRAEIFAATDAMSAAAEAGRMEEALRLSLEFESYWRKEEGSLVRYVRHAELDTITASVAKLGPLSTQETVAEYLAEVHLVRNIIDHIWKSEQPGWRNVL